MRWRLWGTGSIATALALWSCNGFGTDADVNPGDASTTPASDAASREGGVAVPDGDAPTADGGCSNAMPFVSFNGLGTEVNTNFNEFTPRLTADELVMYFTRQDGEGNFASARVRRASLTTPFGDLKLFYEDGSSAQRIHLWPSPDESHVFYAEHRGQWDLVLAQLNGDKTVKVPGPAFIDVLDSPFNDLTPYAAADESEIWFASDRLTLGSLVYDLFHANRLADGGFEAPRAANLLNTTLDDYAPVLSADKLTIYFASGRERASGASIWTATRTTVADEFANPKLAPGLEPLEDEKASIKGAAVPGWISNDNCRLYLTTTKDNGLQDLYVASRR